METTAIKHNGVYACSVVKRRRYGGSVYYEIVFPPEDTFKSFSRDTASEVHSWLDCWYGAGEWECA